LALFGQSCLLARRLVEAGSKFVTVFWDEFAYLNTDWDTHWNQAHRLNGWLLPGFDMAFSGLILDLDRRGLVDETLVVWMSEHGRTPNFNKNAGRDHWSRVYSIALAGGDVAGGNVVGASDRMGGDVLDAKGHSGHDPAPVGDRPCCDVGPAGSGRGDRAITTRIARDLKRVSGKGSGFRRIGLRNKTLRCTSLRLALAAG
jgi:hypothetical protein